MIKMIVVYVMLLAVLGILYVAFVRSVILAKKLGEEDEKKKRSEDVQA